MTDNAKLVERATNYADGLDAHLDEGGAHAVNNVRDLIEFVRELAESLSSRPPAAGGKGEPSCFEPVTPEVLAEGFGVTVDQVNEANDRIGNLYRQLASPRKTASEPKVEGSMACPVCGVDEPHGHSDRELSTWLDAQASRFGLRARVWRTTQPLPTVLDKVLGIIAGTLGMGELTSFLGKRERETAAAWAQEITDLFEATVLPKHIVRVFPFECVDYVAAELFAYLTDVLPAEMFFELHDQNLDKARSRIAARTALAAFARWEHNPSLSRDAPGTAPERVVICGSSRFIDLMAVAAWLIERDEGKIVMGLHLLPAWYPDVPAHHLAEAEGVAAAMDALHLRKIDLADEVFVVNKDGYIGSSTTNEIAYATSRGLPIRYYDRDKIGALVEQLLFTAAAAAHGQAGPADGDGVPVEGEETAR